MISTKNFWKFNLFCQLPNLISVLGRKNSKFLNFHRRERKKFSPKTRSYIGRIIICNFRVCVEVPGFEGACFRGAGGTAAPKRPKIRLSCTYLVHNVTIVQIQMYWTKIYALSWNKWRQHVIWSEVRFHFLLLLQLSRYKFLCHLYIL